MAVTCRLTKKRAEKKDGCFNQPSILKPMYLCSAYRGPPHNFTSHPRYGSMYGIFTYIWIHLVDFYGKLVGINIPFSMGILCMGSQHKTSSGLGRIFIFRAVGKDEKLPPPGGAMFYGTFWCPACDAQRQLFGQPAWQSEPRINGRSRWVETPSRFVGPVWGVAVGCGVLHT